MKCWVHPERDAVSFCKSCGRGVCHDCLVVVGGESYCKVCVESGRVAVFAPLPKPTAPQVMPIPKGAPSKAFFVVGGVGCILATVAAMWRFLSILAPFFAGSWALGYVLLAVSIGLVAMGYLGIRRNYGSALGVASFAVALVVSVLFISWVVLLFGPLPYEEYWRLRLYFGTAMYEIFFAMLILWAVTHIITRRFMGKSGLSLATGIMLIITAAFVEIWTLFLLILWFAGAYGMFELYDIFELLWTSLFLTSEVLAAILFFMATIPKLATEPTHITTT